MQNYGVAPRVPSSLPLPSDIRHSSRHSREMRQPYRAGGAAAAPPYHQCCTVPRSSTAAGPPDGAPLTKKNATAQPSPPSRCMERVQIHPLTLSKSNRHAQCRRCYITLYPAQSSVPSQSNYLHCHNWEALRAVAPAHRQRLLLRLLRAEPYAQEHCTHYPHSGLPPCHLCSSSAVLLLKLQVRMRLLIHTP
jgi:hypothetical protein